MRGLDEGGDGDEVAVVVVGRGEKSLEGEVGEDIERDRKCDAIGDFEVLPTLLTRFNIDVRAFNS